MTIFKYPGQKQAIAPWILAHFPPHYQQMTYLEPFFGSGSIFFAKKRSTVETINDLDSEIFNLFLQIRDNTEALIAKLESTPWSRDDYALAHEYCNDPLEQARRFMVRAWFSIGSSARGLRQNGMRFCIKECNGGFPSFYEKLPNAVRKTAARLKHVPGHIVQIENSSALHLMAKYDRKNVLMYLDPPYVPETRKKKKQYRHEMNAAAHVKLLEKAAASQAKILISGYDSELYRKYLDGWNVDTATAFDEGGNNRTEYLWFNYDAVIQPELFRKGENAEADNENKEKENMI
jgi:DNA adenine methylase